MISHCEEVVMELCEGKPYSSNVYKRITYWRTVFKKVLDSDLDVDVSKKLLSLYYQDAKKEFSDYCLTTQEFPVAVPYLVETYVLNMLNADFKNAISTLDEIQVEEFVFILEDAIVEHGIEKVLKAINVKNIKEKTLKAWLNKTKQPSTRLLKHIVLACNQL